MCSAMRKPSPRGTRHGIYGFVLVAVASYALAACGSELPPRLVVLGDDAASGGNNAAADASSADASTRDATSDSASVLTRCVDESRNPKRIESCANVSTREGRPLPNGTSCGAPYTEALAAGCAFVDGKPDDDLCCPAGVKGSLDCTDISAVAGAKEVCATLSTKEGRAVPKPVSCQASKRAYATDLGCAYDEVKDIMCCAEAVAVADVFAP